MGIISPFFFLLISCTSSPYYHIFFSDTSDNHVVSLVNSKFCMVVCRGRWWSPKSPISISFSIGVMSGFGKSISMLFSPLSAGLVKAFLSWVTLFGPSLRWRATLRSTLLGFIPSRLLSSLFSSARVLISSAWVSISSAWILFSSSLLLFSSLRLLITSAWYSTLSTSASTFHFRRFLSFS